MRLATYDTIEKLKNRVYERSDLHFSEKKRLFFEKRLQERLGRLGLEGYDAYLAYLKENPSEVDALIQDLTTNETFFFRNESQFRALAGSVLPGIVGVKNREVVSSWGRAAGAGKGREVGAEGAPPRHPSMGVRVWSAGCSTGEEAYSIAFTLLDSIRYPRAWDLEVLATDINREVLAAARKGVFGGASLRAMDPAVRDRHMARVTGGWSVSEAARKLVSFRQANMKDVTSAGRARTLRLEDGSGGVAELNVTGRFDVIFCRNVMIYFDHEGQQRLVDALYDCLRPGGYLFTGDSEPLHLFRHGFIRADDDEALYYIRPE